MKIKILFLILSILLITAKPAFADPGIKDLKSFKNIPVMDGGRIKPLDTYARSLLTQFSGKDHYEKKSATTWLASLFFYPQSTLHDKIFLINNPDIATALDMPVDQHRRYTPAQLQKVYRKLAELQQSAQKIPEKERSLIENEIIRIFDNINLYADLSRSFLFAYPHNDFTITSSATKTKLNLPLDQDKFSFIDIALRAKETRELLDSNESELIKTTTEMFHWSLNYQNFPFLVIPTKKNGQWLSPWDAINSDLGNPHSRQLLTQWANMATSYVQNNEIAFNMAVHLYLTTIQETVSKDEIKNIHKFPLELLYQTTSPFTWSIVFYILAFIFFVISFSSSQKIWYQLALACIIAGFIPHTAGLIMRIFIMARPPVSSLYETFIFVGFITVLLGLMIERYNRQWLGIVTAAISGAALLFIANKYSAEGDTFKMLIAVLNSNFWLATHVTTITMGYGATCVGGILGHIWLIQAAFKKDKQILESTYKTTLGILGLALTLTFLGTNLGGIWADQSWGRFWGWDPKENGALMIVIWTAMLFHAKIAKLIGPLGFAVGAVIGMIVVMWAWFGVNLLSVGLHSYGFTSGIATTLLIYVICEIIFLIVTSWSINKK